MPKFSKRSKDALATCHPELQLLFNEIIKYWDCSIIEGYRNQEDQDAAYDRGASKLKYPHGKHNQNPSLAVDVYPWPVKGLKPQDYYLFGGFVLGVAKMLKNEGKMKCDLRYGADWNGNHRISDERFLDAVHFEIKV